ncbi:hypothetical protein QN219_22725 [Sinorhizobium sp. 7-81]|nr:hypothetical protein [Sinorhizobium sp. 8-89]
MDQKSDVDLPEDEVLATHFYGSVGRGGESRKGGLRLCAGEQKAETASYSAARLIRRAKVAVAL